MNVHEVGPVFRPLGHPPRCIDVSGCVVKTHVECREKLVTSLFAGNSAVIEHSLVRGYLWCSAASYVLLSLSHSHAELPVFQFTQNWRRRNSSSSANPRVT